MTKHCGSLLFCFFFFTLFSLSLNAQENPDSTYYFEEVTIAGRAPSRYVETARSVIIVREEEIKQMPARSINELLDNVAGVDIRQRGPAGVQADVSIRGESFENVLILVNGIRINDPQTGHHNLNLPVPVEDIERIEILKGPAARIHGQNAFSGVINFITKKPGKTNVSAAAAVGDFGYYQGLLSASLPLGKYKQNVSVSRSASDGYRPHTDFNSNTLFYQSALALGTTELRGTFGINDKAFGANGFYSDKFPTQWEATRTLFGHVSASIKGRWHVRPNLYWRKHNDEFLLKHENPAFYQNLHTTDVLGGDINASYKSRYGTTSVGTEARREKINSTSLGAHTRDNVGLFVEHRITFKRLVVVPGVFASWYSDYGIQSYPGIDIAYLLTDNFNVYATAGRSYRVPTYTELYYKDPVNRGNALLKPEEAYSYEAGFKFRKQALSLSGAAFIKDGRQVIDWVRLQADSPWQVQNIALVKTNGAEAAIGLSPPVWMKENYLIQSVRVQYTYLNSRRNKDSYLSKYVFDYLRHQLIFGANLRYAKGLFQTFSARYESRMGYSPYWIFDTRLSYRIKRFELRADATNLFNQTYYEMGQIPLPGRWISGGLSWALK